MPSCWRASRWIISGDRPVRCGMTCAGASSRVTAHAPVTRRCAWERTHLTVAGDEVEFAVLSEGEHWVAQAIVGATVVGVQSRNWTLEATGLVAEREFDLYEQEARERRRRLAQ